MNKSFLLPLTILILLPVACAKSGDDTTGAEAKEYIEKWMDKYHNGVRPMRTGFISWRMCPEPAFPATRRNPLSC